MIKKSYLDEINLPVVLRVGAKGPYVKRVQEWINLRHTVDPRWNYVLTADGEFGGVTERVIKLFQKAVGLDDDGVVGRNTYLQLVNPLVKAYTLIPGITEVRPLVVAYALQHLASHPMELNNSNLGPWVRAYMDGHDGSNWPWCMGFVQTILDQAFSTLGKDYRAVMVQAWGCDTVGEFGKKNKRLLSYETIKDNPAASVKPGDAFLIRKKEGYGWRHTGLVESVAGTVLHTIEGNTNDEGSAEGYEACKRNRDLRTEKIDVYSIEPPIA